MQNFAKEYIASMIGDEKVTFTRQCIIDNVKVLEKLCIDPKLGTLTKW